VALALPKNVTCEYFTRGNSNKCELVCDLSNGAISNDLEQTLTVFNVTQGRRHGFESGRDNFASGPLFGQWGDKILLR